MSDASTGVPILDYWLDCCQRSILFLDVLRQRGNQYEAHRAKLAPHVLDFDVELICDGRTLKRPVNYLLVRIIPPAGSKIDPDKPPFVIVDPRAGHGPGIGGMKQSSEVGAATAAGHPCYFIGFLPDPVPGQTTEDVWEAEALFVEQVAKLHADADGKPVVVANCQAGWQTMIMTALHPELTGPILLTGSPLSYWAGERGKNPMRYLGGLLGGTWATALAGDLGSGIFDGANLVANFESLHPDHSWWSKPYNLYSNVDTEADRFLEFETWWGSPVLLNAGEMQWIADNLFVGNKLTSGALTTSGGVRIDLRNIRAPVVAFCSRGDDITPPQQALGWITDVYQDEREIAAAGKTIVYALHENVGHLGIFVSGKVADKEHSEFASCIRMVELVLPGLYEAVITAPEEGTANPSLIEGKYLFRLEPRTIGDIRALGGNSAEDDRSFAAAARVSEAGRALYETAVRPIVQQVSNPQVSEAMRGLHPSRVRFAAFSDNNPAMRAIGPLAETVRRNRQPVTSDNLFLQWEGLWSEAIASGLRTWSHLRDTIGEALFLQIYGSRALQALAGLAPDSDAPRKIQRDLASEVARTPQRVRLEEALQRGGTLEAAVRALLYVRLPEGGADERAFTQLRNLRAARPGEKRVTVAHLKDVLKEQAVLVAIDPDRAIDSLAGLLPADPDERRQMFEGLKSVIVAPGALSAEGQRRLERIEQLFTNGMESEPAEDQHA